ncbi:uncharacterized protein A4U43_C07F19920 [Asparagus officinalis]|uniref:Uncharacterized protein n=1 Tax=Asparagus officinalis TaxID=4686 RepID=A0A5P1EDI8_ASPOF|nr:uncharacterized protein A4U43_C07F19920 [Asparagus officinalis]
MSSTSVLSGNRGDYDSNPPHAKSKPKVQLTPFVAAPKGKQNNTPNEDNKTNNNGFRKDNKCQSDFHLTYPRIHESHPKDSLTPSPVQSKGTNDDRLDEDNKTNIRASSVPMPRAVLSSPDNDELIGSQNQSIREKQTPLRRQTLKSNDITSQQSQLSREKITLTKRPASSPKTEGQTKIENTHSTRKSCTEKGKGSSLSTPKQRPPFKGNDVRSEAMVATFLTLSMSTMLGNMIKQLHFDSYEWVHSVVREKWTVKVFDKRMLSEGVPEDRMLKLLLIALKCIYKSADARPTMSQVAGMIHSLKEEEDMFVVSEIDSRDA